MRRLIGLAVLLAASFFSVAAHANAPILICAKNMETTQMFHSMAFEASGADLNTATRTDNYNPLAHFLVVTWDDTHVTILVMQGSPSFFPTEVTDEEGHAWEVSLYSAKTCP